MANIRVDVNYTIKDGSKIVFRSPVDCSAITGLVVYYVAEDGTAASREFVLSDAHGHDVGNINHLFAENVIVKVILDVTAGMAYVQNADTNAYIERTFVKTVNGVAPDGNGNVTVGAPDGNSGTSGLSIFYTKNNLDYDPDSLIAPTALLDKADVETHGRAMQVGDLVLFQNGTLATVTAIDTTTGKASCKAVAKLMASPGGTGLTTAQINALDGMFKVCAFIKSDISAEYAAFKTAFGIADSDDHAHSYTSAVTTAATCTTAGVRTYTCSCGKSYTERIPATGHNYVDGVCTVCGATDPSYKEDVTLTRISATYSGGDVTVGTALAELTGIVVKAHYSDGSSETVTGYTLSGTIAEGSNTVTVTYQGMTTTFAVTGVAVAQTYTVTNNLTNVTNSNTATTASGYYSATLSAEYGYTISVAVTMGGMDITESVYTEDGTILITEVTGDIVITAVAELAESPVLYQLANTPVTCNADLYEDTGLTFGSSSANGYTKAWTICVDVIVTTYSKHAFCVATSDSTRCLGFTTNGAGTGQIYILNNNTVTIPSNAEQKYKFVITRAANEAKKATVHRIVDGAVVSTEVSGSYGAFNNSVYAANLFVGGKTAAEFAGTINDFIIYEGILSDAHIAEFLEVA